MAGNRIYFNSLIGRYAGGWGPDEYLRSLTSQQPGVAAVCKKPRYTKAQKKKMAQRPQVQRFVAVNAEASAIFHDPVLRAEWEKRHAAFKREAEKKGERTYPRLWDFVRHELLTAKTTEQK